MARKQNGNPLQTGLIMIPQDNNIEASWGKRLLVTMVMNLIIPAVQIFIGVMAGSIALISDALHNLGDFISVLISYVVLRIGQRGPTLKHTFGYKRLEVFAAVFSVALLYGIGFYIAVEGWKRLQNPQAIQGQIVMWGAFVGFLANAISTLMLRSGARVNLNIRGAFLHMLSDALTSLGVFILGVVWIYRPWYWLDPIVSWIIVAMILFGGWDILKKAFFILMNATPEGIDVEAIQRDIEALDGIKEIHHLHVWNMSSERVALAAHIIVPDQMLSKVDELAAKVRELLFCRFNVDHPVLQFETRPYEEASLLCCPVTGNR